jgi:hypothetical protein
MHDIYIYIYIYMYVCIYIYIYIYRCANIHKHIHTTVAKREAPNYEFYNNINMCAQSMRMYLADTKREPAAFHSIILLQTASAAKESPPTACMYLCTYVCMYVRTYVRTYADATNCMRLHGNLRCMSKVLV